MIPYLLESTGDFSDRTREIERALKEKGVCILGSGVFSVTGITMPPSSTLMGLGDASVIYLSNEVEEGFAVTMQSRCCIKNLALKGAEEPLPIPSEEGTRHGIGFLGDATPEKRGNQICFCTVESCQIRNFSGGGITCRDTGYSTSSSMVASNCHITGCFAGINISHFSEYHRFSNMHCVRNTYGCINNGGNNVFSACGFDSNQVGFFIDNENGKSPNNSHGTVVACTFNHSGGNRGIGIWVRGAQHGYVFTACQIFFSQVILESSVGIQFHDCNLGRQVVFSASGGGITLFTDSFFLASPELDVKDDAIVKFHHCYLKTGEELQIP